ncbi:MAG: phosphate/phosphite/phosphonate ABC transporter substrate-binding protein [Anaerolineales bacterium]|nr:phosphate/phosphite/phosphonate ABC transporter substrate-binding protein [Anaerolineales bacterium]
MKKNRRIWLVLFVALTILALVLTGCKKEAALGTEENPIVMAVVPSGETEQVVSGFQQIADFVYEDTGLVIEPFVATEYAGVIEAMCSDPPKAQIASLATFSYIIAHERGCADVALVSVRYGRPVYDGQIIVGADSGIESLEDLAGKTFCRPDPTSTSGWIIPAIMMRAAGVNPDTDLAGVVDAGGHPGVATAVYTGDCDAGATFVDARTAIEEEYPDVNDKVTVLVVSDPIPNDGVQFNPDFPAEMRDQIIASLIKMSETEAGQEALQTAYSWNSLEPHDDTFYDGFRQVLEAAGVDPAEYAPE